MGIPGEEAGVVFTTLLNHRRALVPAVRRELHAYRAIAERVGDRRLRTTALRGLAEKASNAEATAVLCITAPRPARARVLRASTALQVAIDYLDLRGEEPDTRDLASGLALHASLGTALREPGDRTRQAAGATTADTYLEELLGRCRSEATALPSAAAILPLARSAAIRCGEGQSYTHAAASDPTPLRDWALGLGASADFEWWEVGAGASSSVAAHALLALAATPGVERAQGELLDAAYFPSIGALTVLLDDLADRDADRRAGEHNYLDYYPSDSAAAERLAALSALAREATSPLRHRARHRAILTGVLAYYLSEPSSGGKTARGLRDRVLRSSGLTVRALSRLIAARHGHR